jgi:hypothetical protein
MDIFAPHETVGAGQIPPVAGQVLDFFILYPLFFILVFSPNGAKSVTRGEAPCRQGGMLH